LRTSRADSPGRVVTAPSLSGMARAPRIEVPGGIYHVGAEGNRKCRIFADDYERRIFLMLLAKQTKRHQWDLLTYVLMTNHYHLLLRLRGGGLSDGMCGLNGEFARLTNRRHGLVGHLFRKRFWSDFAEDDSHLLQAARYVVLNPIRAGICKRPEDWPWSSYRACAGFEFAPEFLAANELLKLFGTSPAKARRAYRAFVQEGIDDWERERALGARHRDESRAAG
jgi:putative transposase